MKAASLIPKTLSTKYPPMIGKMTFGHEYHAYRFSNWYVVMPIAARISFWKKIRPTLLWMIFDDFKSPFNYY